MNVDIIGDIHGYADRLEALLKALGYVDRGGAWRHPDRAVIFVGDFIDRGPGQLRTLKIVRAMIGAGSARAVMGNHELNAIGWATPDPHAAGRYLRARHGAKGDKNRRQHEAFLSEVDEDSAEHRAWIDWFLELPLWIEERGFRVVHACWDPAAADEAGRHLRPGHLLDPEALATGYRHDEAYSAAIDTLLKGPEVRMPDGFSFTDKDGHFRHEIRTRWWSPQLRTFRDAYIGPSGVHIPAVALPEGQNVPVPDRPTFIGHYWLEPAEAARPLSSMVACVDYSVARGGPLVAYRFGGEQTIQAHNFVCV